MKRLTKQEGQYAWSNLHSEAERDRGFLYQVFIEPEIFLTYQREAMKVKAAGHDRWSMQNLTEKMRWDMVIVFKRADTEYVLSHNWQSRYSRTLMAVYPELDDLFEIRGCPNMNVQYLAEGVRRILAAYGAKQKTVTPL